MTAVTVARPVAVTPPTRRQVDCPHGRVNVTAHTVVMIEVDFNADPETPATQPLTVAVTAVQVPFAGPVVADPVDACCVDCGWVLPAGHPVAKAAAAYAAADPDMTWPEPTWSVS